MQVLFKDLPISFTAVDCNGSETSISECPTQTGDIVACSLDIEMRSTILACANTTVGDHPTHSALRHVLRYTLCHFQN